MAQHFSTKPDLRPGEADADADAAVAELVRLFARCLAEEDFRARLANEGGTQRSDRRDL